MPCSLTCHLLLCPTVDKDVERLALFPNLDSKELYDTLYEFIPGLRAIPSSGNALNKSLYPVNQNCDGLASHHLAMVLNFIQILSKLCPFLIGNVIVSARFQFFSSSPSGVYITCFNEFVKNIVMTQWGLCDVKGNLESI